MLSYVALYIGIAVGMLWRFLRLLISALPKHSPEKNRFPSLRQWLFESKQSCVCAWQALIARIAAAIRAISAVASSIWRKIVSVVHSAAHSIAVWMLSVDEIYIFLKTAKVYSAPHQYVRMTILSDIKSYCQQTGNRYTVVEPSTMRQVCQPAVFEKQPQKVSSFESPEIYIAELKNITVSGGSSILLARPIWLERPAINF